MSREVKLFSLEQGLLVKPEADAPVRFVVVTESGPRHVDLETLRKLVDAPVPMSHAEVERIVSDNAQAIASLVKGPDIVPVEAEPLDFNTLPVHFDVHPAVDLSFLDIAPSSALGYEDHVLAEGDALGFINALSVDQGRLDLTSHYWPVKPEAAERPERPASGCTVAELLAWKAADDEWMTTRQLELAQWRRECQAVKGDGSQAAEQPQYVLSGSNINSLAEQFGLPLRMLGDGSLMPGDASALVPALLQGLQQLYTYMHSPQYKAQVVESFHEAMREARAARLRTAESD